MEGAPRPARGRTAEPARLSPRRRAPALAGAAHAPSLLGDDKVRGRTTEIVRPRARQPTPSLALPRAKCRPQANTSTTLRPCAPRRVKYFCCNRQHATSQALAAPTSASLSLCRSGDAAGSASAPAGRSRQTVPSGTAESNAFADPRHRARCGAGCGLGVRRQTNRTPPTLPWHRAERSKRRRRAARRSARVRAIATQSLGAACFNHGVEGCLIGRTPTASFEHRALLDGKHHVMHVALHVG